MGIASSISSISLLEIRCLHQGLGFWRYFGKVMVFFD
ncbi:hypothetical protein V6Z12_A02G048300 [Gossypium hirsutum]